MAKELWNVSEEPGGGSLRGGPAAQGHVEAPLPQLSPRDPIARRRQPLKLLDSVGISGPQIPGTYLASRCGDRARHDNVTLWGLSMPGGKGQLEAERFRALRRGACPGDEPSRRPPRLLRGRDDHDSQPPESSRDPRRCDRRGRSGLIWALLLLPILALAGCGGMGPGTVTRDRFDYTAAVADSWKSQMLLNLVKIRYGDAPVFLDVGQIVAGYSFQRNLNASATVPVFNGTPPSSVATDIFGLSGGGSYNDSPTITYAPLAGERFARSLMMPIPPSAIMNVTQAGFPVEMVFRLAVQSLNGVDNRRVRDFNVQPAEPEFYALLQNLRRLQNSGDIGMRMSPGDHGEVQLEMVLRPKAAAAVENARINVAKILGLDPSGRVFRLVYGTVPKDDKEIAILTRSIYEVLKSLAANITVPETHVIERRVSPTPSVDLGPEGPIPPLIRITSSSDHPADAFVAVPYHGYWFSIDDQDLRSKNLFSFIMYLFTFVETGSKEATPILTIPTTR